MAAHEDGCSGHFVDLMLIDWLECEGMKKRSEQSFLGIECGHNNSFKTRAHSGLHALSSVTLTAYFNSPRAANPQKMTEE